MHQQTGHASVASVSDDARKPQHSDEARVAGRPLLSQAIRFARLSDVQESEPDLERKCTDCGGDGVLPVFNVKGIQCATVTCTTCGGSRYAP